MKKCLSVLTILLLLGVFWGCSDDPTINPDQKSTTITKSVLSPTDPNISFTYIPPYGSTANIIGKVTNLNPTDYKVALFINVTGNIYSEWYVKPTYANPFTAIQGDLSWTCDFTTGGGDQYTKIFDAFLLPSGFVFPNGPSGMSAHSDASSAAVAFTRFNRNDTTTPTAIITGPYSDEIRYNSPITVTGTASDETQLEGIYYSINNSPFVKFSDQTTWELNLNLAEGTNLVQVYSKDFGGNVSTVSVVTYTYVNDTVAPTISITNLPSSRLTHYVYTLSGTAADDHEIEGIYVEVNNKGFVKASGTTTWSIPLTLVFGNNLIKVYSQDKAGNKSIVMENSILYKPIKMRWATRQGSFWDTQKWIAGDFTGDRSTDLANVYNDSGYATIDIHNSTGSSFGIQRWATRQGGFWDTQKWIAGNFDGVGGDDLANVFNDYGYASIDVHPSSGSSFGIQRWATRQGGFWDTQKWSSGNFNGVGGDDLANVFNDSGYATIDVHPSSGSSFGIQRWATRQGGFWDTQKWSSGNFNGVGGDDLANVFNDYGYASMDIHASTGSSFGIQRWATRRGGFWDTQRWLSGDIDGDGKADMVNVFNDWGKTSFDIHYAAGNNSFTSSRWKSQLENHSDSYKWLIGDVDGDGHADLIKVFNDAGQASIDVYFIY